MNTLGKTNPEDARNAVVTWLDALGFVAMAKDADNPKKTPACELYRYVRLICSETQRLQPAIYPEVSRMFRALGF